MRTLHAAMLTILVSISTVVEPAAAQVQAGISIDEGGVNGFYLAIGSYYKVPEKQVIYVVKERRIPDEEVPVVFFVAARARVEPETIIVLRRSGKTWVEICTHYGLSQEIFFVPVAVEVKGARYGRAYGHYKHKGRKEAKAFVLTDDEVVNLVNLKFISEHYGYPPEEVIGMRDDGKNFVSVNDEVRKAKHGKKKGKG